MTADSRTRIFISAMPTKSDAWAGRQLYSRATATFPRRWPAVSTKPSSPTEKSLGPSRRTDLGLRLLRRPETEILHRRSSPPPHSRPQWSSLHQRRHGAIARVVSSIVHLFLGLRVWPICTIQPRPDFRSLPRPTSWVGEASWVWMPAECSSDPFYVPIAMRRISSRCGPSPTTQN